MKPRWDNLEWTDYGDMMARLLADGSVCKRRNWAHVEITNNGDGTYRWTTWGDNVGAMNSEANGLTPLEIQCLLMEKWP